MKAVFQNSSPHEKATAGGWLLFLLGLSFFLSALPDLRPKIAGMSVHPYIGVLFLLALNVLFVRKRMDVKQSLGGWGAAFVLAICLSHLANGDLTGSLRSIVKWATMLVTFGLVARATRTIQDLRLALWGLIFGIALIGVRALILHQSNPGAFLDPMPGIGSRNNFSLWTLAPFCFSMWMITDSRTAKKIKLLLIVAMLCMVVPLAMSLSRASMGLIVFNAFLVLMARRSVRTAIALALVTVGSLYAIDYFEFGTLIQNRMNTMRHGGTDSDLVRGEIIGHGIDVFMRNPIFGVSTYRLGSLLGQAVRGGGGLSSHNLFIDLLAGTGLVGSLSFVMCSLMLIKKWLQARRAAKGLWSDFAGVLPILLLLVAIRGFTSNEVVFCPAIMMGLALSFAAANHTLAEQARTVAGGQAHGPSEGGSLASGLVPNLGR
jgi:O-antigen ligase